MVRVFWFIEFGNVEYFLIFVCFRYIVKAEDKLKFQELVQKMSIGIQLATECNKISQHKSVMIPPSKLKENGVQFVKVVFYFISIFFYSVVSFHLLSGDSTSRPVHSCILGGIPCCRQYWL